MKCDTVIESKFRHDFVKCPCGACFVDGGLDYQRCGGHFDDMVIVKDDDTEVSLFNKEGRLVTEDEQ